MRVSNLKPLKAYVAILLLLCLVAPTNAYAASSNQVPARLYETTDGSLGYALSPSNSVLAFAYGEKDIGSFSLHGTVNKSSTVNGFPAYAVTDGLTVRYSYDGGFRDTEKEGWHLISDSGKTVAGITLPKKIESGVFIVQKSTDRSNWENAREPIYNIFAAKKIDWENLYTVSVDELKTGTYFRVIVAYEMGRKTGENPGSVIPLRLPSDIYEYLYCCEVYEFFTCYGNSQVSFRNLSSGEALLTGAIVQDGFIIDKNGSANSVTVKRDSGETATVTSLTSYTSSGKYTITEITPVGQTYTFYFEVSGGLKTLSLNPTIYQNDERDKYTTVNGATGSPAFGISSHTLLTIGQNSSTPITSSTRKGLPAFGVTGSNVSLYLRLQGMDKLSATGWEIVTDTWGKRESQTIDGTYAGQINSGTLIIQTSLAGSKWVNADLDRYADGLYTTDYEAYYGGRGDVLIYTPDGQDVLNGIYLRILYAYEVKNTSSKEDYRVIEEYKFYLCSDALDAVTFHNLSVDKTLEEIIDGYDDATARVYQQAETLVSGAYTVNGFRIDDSLNPTVTFTATRNGAKYYIPSSNIIDQTGRYEITLKSAVNSTKTVTLFVDRMTTEEALAMYFGDCFITGKRIYSEGEYAVYEGGLTNYQIQAISDNFIPVSGHIKNLTNDEVIDIPATRGAKKGTLRSPGLYEAVLSTTPSFEGEEIAGDTRTFIFRFSIIAEGTAPGPVVNQGSLATYATTTITDSYPKYYGLTFSSASKGNITLAFSTREAAVAYAMAYEQGMVEKQSDGRYRYIGSFITQQKELYESNWDLMDAVEFFADQAVQELYFDLSDEFTVITLSDDVIEGTANLRTLELNNSVVVFADGQKPELTALNSLPIISPKPYYYLSPGVSGTISTDYYDFEFVHDQFGCDSGSVIIIDVNGKEYSIKYNQGVGAQLAAHGCPSGIVTIVESTVYGDTATYQAVYIADGYNSTEVVLSYFEGGVERQYTYSRENIGTILSVEAFSIDSIHDGLDPYSLVIVSHNNSQYSYVADKPPMDAWADLGVYTIKVVNRLGFSYSFTVNVIESDFATLSFTGEGTDTTGYILTRYREQHIELPRINRYGYNLIGFKDENDVLYQGEIALVPFSGSVVLTAVWEAKQYTLTLKAPDGSTIQTKQISFGRTTELPIPTLSDGISFAGWSHDGIKLDSNFFTLRTESDVTLVAIGTTTEPIEEENEAVVHKALGVWVYLVIISVIVVIGIVIKINNRKKNTHVALTSVGTVKEDGKDEE